METGFLVISLLLKKLGMGEGGALIYYFGQEGGRLFGGGRLLELARALIPENAVFERL